MNLEHRAITALRVVLVVLFGILLVFQTMSLPGQFRYQAEQNPEDAHLRWPATIIAVFLVLCVQVVVVSIWQLLTLVRKDRIFHESAFRWVNAIIAAIAAGGVTLAAVLLWIGFRADDPAAPLILFLMLTAVTVVGLLMVVMRALLRKATELRSDLESVI